ncbi:Cdc7p-Dbf4p kinase complex regulatory subunit [Coemansia sp. RSA 552]|nr:Cdc7p-Dbf4p kinase complex regulatory subunit [Coemansia sp. RSA 552]
MSSRKLKFDASRPAARHLGASPAGRSALHNSHCHADFMSPGRVLATPTRPAQRATLARRQQHQSMDAPGLASPLYSPSLAQQQSRRSPLQAITNKEHTLSNTQPLADGGRGAASSKAPAVAHQSHMVLSAEQQREQKARVAEWVLAYRRAFPSFVFYFEGIDEATVQRLTVPIRSLGAKVETFFSAQTVTHVIVEHPSMASAENAASSGSHVLSLARRFHLKIWDAEKLEKRVLYYLLPGYNASAAQNPSIQSAKRKLNEAFSAEKLYSMRHKTFEGSSVAHCVDFYYFKYIYVLVEDASHLHRPAIMEDYRPPEPGRDPPWPKLYMVPTGRCPFVQYEDPTTSSKGSDTDADYNKENMTPDAEPTTLPTAQLQSKTPATKRQLLMPRPSTWTPTADMAGSPVEEGARRPFATVATNRLRESGAPPPVDPRFLTPTRPSRVRAADLDLGPERGNAAGDAHALIDSNASGIAQSHGVTSTSTAFHLNAMDPVMQRGLLQNLNGGRMTHLSRLEHPVAAGASQRPAPPQPIRPRARRGMPPVPRTKKPRAPVRRPVVARPGYCENCRVKFEDMLDHVKTPQHRRFAANERNWVELDSLLDHVRRPLRQQSPDQSPREPASALYALSSDDASQPGTLTGGQSLNASGPVSLGGAVPSWDSYPSTRRPGLSTYTSTQFFASGRLSTEALETAEATSVAPAHTSQQPATRPTSGVIDLTYSTNSSCESTRGVVSGTEGAAHNDSNTADAEGVTPVTPLPIRNFGHENGSIEVLVSSLETPRFCRSEDADTASAGDGPATLVASHRATKRPRLSGGHKWPQAETPTRDMTAANTSLNDGENADPNTPATLVQPPRAKHASLAPHQREAGDSSPHRRQRVANRLCYMLHEP